MYIDKLINLEPAQLLYLFIRGFSDTKLMKP